MKILKKLFTKKRCRKCKYIKESLNILDKQIQDNYALNNECLHFQCLTLISKINLLSEQIIFFEENSPKHDYLLITVQTDTESTGLIRTMNFFCYVIDKLSTEPDIKMRMFTEFNYSTDYKTVNRIEIVDIIWEPSNGYGSKIMTVFLNYIQYFNWHTKEIYGYLSDVDELNPENQIRRNNFYKKFGFEIKNRYISKRL